MVLLDREVRASAIDGGQIWPGRVLRALIHGYCSVEGQRQWMSREGFPGANDGIRQVSEN
jgi:hypothetical protein